LYYSFVRRFSVLLGLAVLALGGCYSGSRPSNIGTVAPDFTVTDSTHSVSLDQFRGKVVVLNFWASWCQPCVDEVPSLMQMQQELKSKGVVVFAVSVDDDPTAYHRFLKDYGVDFLTIRDASQKSNELYGTHMFPETYIIDRKGILRRKFIGEVQWTQPDIIHYLTDLADAGTIQPGVETTKNTKSHAAGM
jgi:cytochrome c biogenesis protein CcmG, thiol:disulfide interchange protein DsbE